MSRARRSPRIVVANGSFSTCVRSTTSIVFTGAEVAMSCSILQVATAGPLERKAPARLGPEYRHTTLGIWPRLACPNLLRFFRCCWIWTRRSDKRRSGTGGAPLHQKMKQQRDHSGRSLKHTPGPLSACQNAQWYLIFLSARTRARTAERGAHGHAREVACRPAGACGRVVVLKGTVYH